MKKILCILLMAVIAVTMSGCNSSKLKNENETMLKMLQENESKIKELEGILQGTQTEQGPTSAISAMSDGSSRLTFNSFKGKIVFPVPFEYKGATQAPNTGSINVSQSLSIVPSNNWLIKMDGTSTKFNHTSGITGVIRVGTIDTAVAANTLQEIVFKPFVSKLPPGNVTYGKLFIENTQFGLYGNLTTRINGKPAMLRVGTLGYGTVSLVYMFVYEGEEDATKNELIDNLVKTVKISGQQLRFE